eukprot:1458364-Amphidinium_carterae.1
MICKPVTGGGKAKLCIILWKLDTENGARNRWSLRVQLPRVGNKTMRDTICGGEFWKGISAMPSQNHFGRGGGDGMHTLEPELDAGVQATGV